MGAAMTTAIIKMEAFLIQQFEISFIDVSAYIGLTAAGLMTLNLLIGLLLSVQYDSMQHWPRKRLPLLDLHKWSGYSALFVSLLHPAWLPFTKVANFSVIAVFFPFVTVEQPILLSLGALAMYTLIFVIVTAYLRHRFKYTFWKKLHYATYIVLASFLVHGIFTEPSLKANAVIDYLDGGKLFIEACAVLCIAMVFWRVSYGRKRRAANAAKAPAPVWQGELVIEAITSIRDDVKLFRLKVPSGGELPFAYRAGQYLSFRLKDAAGERIFTRSYSICSSPKQRTWCEIAVKRAVDGKGSGLLHDQAEVGQRLTCTGPHGNFVFDSSKADGIVLVAGGIGVTPLLSIVRDLADQNWPHDVLLLFAISAPPHALFSGELQALQQRYARFRYLVVPSRVDRERWPGPTGRLEASHFSALVPRIADLPIFLCGPDAMMSATISILKTMGVDQGMIQIESFGGPITQDAALCAATIRFAVSGKSGVVSVGQTLLDAAEECGVQIESLCRTGTCGTCKVKLVSGEVHMQRETALSGSDVRNRVVLACQARAITPIVEVSL